MAIKAPSLLLQLPQPEALLSYITVSGIKARKSQINRKEEGGGAKKGKEQERKKRIIIYPACCATLVYLRRSIHPRPSGICLVSYIAPFVCTFGTLYNVKS
jgi:uncharacterized membrane protein